MKKIIFLVITLLPFCSVLAQIMVANYEFTNGSTNNSLSNGLNATLYGGVTSTAGAAGVSNTALKFDGATGYLLVPSNSQFNLTTWTISAVVKIDSWYTGVCQVNRIVSRGTAYGDDYIDMEVNDNAFDHDCTTYSNGNGELLQAAAAGGNSTPWTYTDYLNLNQWYCFTESFDGTVLRVFINGVFKDSSICPANAYTGYPSTADLYIGKGPGLSPFPYWLNGEIDQLTIWSGAITDQYVIHTNCGTCGYTWGGNEWSPTNIKNNTNRKEDMLIYPNPTENILNVSIPNDWKNASATIINTIGKTVLVKQIANNVQSIDITDLPSGFYTLQVNFEVGMSTKNFIKK